MDFGAYDPKPPTSVHAVIIKLQYVDDGSENGNESIQYEVDIRDEDGVRLHPPISSGDLVPFMTGAQISSAQTFLRAMVEKAQTLIPT